MYFLLFISIWILLPLEPSSTLCILIFLLCFLFGFVCITSENQLFPHRQQRSISFLCSSQHRFFSDHPSAFSLFPYSSHPWFLSSFFSFFDVPLGAFSSSFLPSWLARHSPEKVLTNSSWAVFAGLYQVGTPTKESFGSLATLLTGVIPNLHFRVAYTLPLSKLRKMKVGHNLGSMCQYLVSYICFLVFGDCAEIRSHNNNSKIVRLSSAALARDLVLPALLSLRKRTF